MPTPQWAEPPGQELHWGLDRTATPPWFLVPHHPQGGELLLRLTFGKGKVVSSMNERICRVRPADRDPADPESSYFWFTGKSPGPTRVEVRNPGGKVPEAVLSVDVFAHRTISLLFHFIEDRGGNKTTRPPGILGDLIDQLNGIFESQTNVTFESSETGNEVKVPFNIMDPVYEAKDPLNKNMGSNWGNLSGRRDWEQVFRKNNDNRALNIYFTPTDQPAASNDNVVPYIDTTTGSCVIEDGREPIEIMLPHAIGRLLGCPLNTSNRSHLMFWDATIRRSDNFIPKSCAKIIHGQGR